MQKWEKLYSEWCIREKLTVDWSHLPLFNALPSKPQTNVAVSKTNQPHYDSLVPEGKVIMREVVRPRNRESHLHFGATARAVVLWIKAPPEPISRVSTFSAPVGDCNSMSFVIGKRILFRRSSNGQAIAIQSTSTTSTFLPESLRGARTPRAAMFAATIGLLVTLLK